MGIWAWTVLGVFVGLVGAAFVGAKLVTRQFARVVGTYFDSEGVQLHYTVQGEGETIVLLHGFVLNADLNWRRPGIIDRLARQYRVVALDMRGHGLSDKPHDADAYGQHMVDDVRRLLEHLGIARAHLIGYSTGGFITLKFLTQHPERLLTAAATGMSRMPFNEENRATLKQIGLALEDRGDFRPLLERLNIPTRSPYARLRMALVARINDTRALSHVIRAFEAFEISDEAMRSNTVPTLTLVGSDDPIGEGAEAMHEIMANHSLVWLKGGNKLSSLELPGFCDALLEHLKRDVAR